MAIPLDIRPAKIDAESPLAHLPGLPTLDETYGVVLVGSLISLALYGTLLHQTYRYLQMYKKDPLINRIFVYSLFILDTVHGVLCLHACYAYLVTNYFNPLQLTRGIWSLQIQPLIAGFGLVISQSFFARRVYMINVKHKWLVAASMLLTFVAFGCAVAGTVIALKFQSFLQYERFYWIDSLACGSAVAADTLTTVVLIFNLKRSRTGFKQTDTMLDRLIQYAINTGLLIGITNTLALIFALARSQSFIWIAVEFIAFKLYSNSVLAMLNSRRSLKEVDISDHLELSLPTLPSDRSATPPVFNVPSKSSSRAPAWDSGSAVHVASTSERRSDS